ncbi:ROK family protein [Saccharomonospora glauca]|uniref:Transcriptional regulator/sugar kinase n=1 Tax=Saccharomonospora glauca K62 TaxID=928724 RepID=I1D2N7_9PSEU|nr:ROK family protein [Saccharomonospora glauca]EIE99211.1 transcriptional regulator/sugar kinase [Saccharomonospora glauca K62]
MRRVAAVDIGGTKIAVAEVNAEGDLGTRLTAPTPSDRGADAVLDTVTDLVLSLNGVEAVGVGSAGVIDPRTGVVVSATDTIKGWAGTPLRAELENRLRVPVAVAGDVHAHAVGEHRLGTARHATSLLLVTAGTGIGGAWSVNGEVVPGTHGAAGHLGHVPVPAAVGRPCTCGGHGHVEAVASGPAMTAEYRRRCRTTVHGLTDVVTRVRAGDPVAAAVLTDGGAALGSALGGVVNTLAPDLVVVGGGVANSGEPWWSALTTAVAEELLPALRDVPVVRSILGSDAALVGAAFMAWESFR